MLGELETLTGIKLMDFQNSDCRGLNTFPFPVPLTGRWRQVNVPGTESGDGEQRFKLPALEDLLDR